MADKNTENKKEKGRIKLTGRVFFEIVFIVTIIAFIKGEFYLNDSSGIHQDTVCELLSDGWLLIGDDGSREAISVPGKFATTDGTVVVERTIPVIGSADQCICIRSSQQEVRGYIDDELVVSYLKNEESFAWDELASAYLFIHLSPECSGKILRLELSSDSTYSGRVNAVYLGTEMGIWRFLFRENLNTIMLILAMLAFSLITLTACLIIKYRFKEDLELRYLVTCVFLVSFWALCDCRIRQYYMPSINTAAFVSYTCEGLIPIPFIWYMYGVQNPLQVDGSRGTRYYKTTNIVYLFVCSVAILCPTLHFAHLVSFSDTYYLRLFSIAATIIYIVVTVIIDIVKKRAENYRWIIIGLVLFFLGGAMEVFASVFTSYRHNKSFMLLGLLMLSVGAVLKTFMDVQRLNSERLAALELADSRSRFLSSMSHELRTPINTVIGLNEMIKRETTEPNIAEYSGNIDTAGRLLLSLINDILDFSKMKSGVFNIREEEYRLKDIIRNIDEVMQPRIRDKGLAFTVNADPGLPAVLKGDDIRIKQIMVNFMTNAVKYTEKGEVVLTVKGEKDESGIFYLLISVKDSGIGIKPEDQEKLFSEFTRVDEGRIKGIEGTGLGLAIVKMLLDAMKGTVSVSSVYGEGSEFTARIPQAVCDESPMGEWRKTDADRHSGKKEQYVPLFTAPDAVVLAVDDNKMNLLVLKRLLAKTGITIETAESGSQALEMSKNKKYDLIFMDHLMPGMDGVETFHAITDDSTNINRSTPVILLTANIAMEIEGEYAKEGFSAYLSKPIEFKKMEIVVKDLLPSEKIR